MALVSLQSTGVKELKHEEMSKRILEKIFKDHQEIFEAFGLRRDPHLRMILKMIEGFDDIMLTDNTVSNLLYLHNYYTLAMYL